MNPNPLHTALALHQTGALDQAETLYRQILAQEPQHFEALRLLGTIAAQRAQSSLAVEYFAQALKINPNEPGMLNNLGYALRDLGRLDDALRCYDRALGLEPAFGDAHNNRGLVLADMNRLEDALESYDHAIQLSPANAKALCNRGAVLKDLKRPQEALASFDAAIRLQPHYAEAHNNRASVLTELDRAEDALAGYEQALLIRPNYVEAHNNHGLALLSLKRPAQALASFDHALSLAPAYPQILCNRGSALADLDRLDEALASFSQALQHKPDLAQALVNQGNILSQLRRTTDALACYEKAIALAPQLTDAIHNQGVALAVLNQPEQALAAYAQVLKTSPHHAKALINRGNVLRDLGRLDEALSSYEHALQVRPDFEFLLGTWLHTKMKICDWSAHAEHLERLEIKLLQGLGVSPPFPVLSLTHALPLCRKVAETWVKAKCPANRTLPPLSKLPRHAKIRIGYFSADLHNHATAHLIAEMLELHDKTRFELFAFSFGPQLGDPMSHRVAAAFDHFFDLQHHSDKAIAELARAHEIDIAVDLKGFTQDSRPQIFAWRAAPVQVSYLGYPGTMGAGYMDYLIADHTLVPEAEQPHYAEKLVYLPHSYQVNDTRRPISTQQFSRADMGLPASGFVYCCFNNNYKITPQTFDSWMRILLQVPDSVLWLFEDNPSAANNLRKEAVARGVDPHRLVFAKRMRLPDHLARHQLADLFLDTLPYGAHTTASDALWTGLPVLTCLGTTFAGRVAASLLRAIELPELVTDHPAAYEQLAITLATQAGTLSAIKTHLKHNKTTAPLFNSRLTTHHIETAYVEMVERYHADLPKQAIYLPVHPPGQMVEFQAHHSNN